MTLARGRWLVLSVVTLAILASVTGLTNGFVYDDQVIIVGNANVHTLAALGHRFSEPYWPPDRGTGLYRPLTIVLFALQWAGGGGTPFLFHLVNLLLYAALAGMVFLLARLLLPEPAAWVAAALFAVDPVHVEAVANGVGQAELTTALAVVSALVLYLKCRQRSAPAVIDTGRLIALVLLYLAACLSKEHGVILPALLVLAECTVVDDPRPWYARFKSLAVPYLLLTVTGLLYLGWRAQVLGNIPADIQAMSFQSLTTSQRVMTALALVPEWLRLLFWPAHLQADYAPQETRVLTALAPVVALSLVALSGLLALAVAARRRVPPVTLSLGWMAIALLPVSNLLVVSGQVLAERTMMLPSVGAALLLGCVAAWAIGRIRNPLLAQAGKGLVTLLVLAGLMLSAFRQPVWATDRGLRAQTVLDAPRSYWAQWMWGDWLFTHGQPAEGERHMRRAVELYDDNPFILRTLATRYQDNGFCPAATPLLRRTLALRPGWWEIRVRLARCLRSANQPEEAGRIITEGIALGAGADELRRFEAVPDSLHPTHPSPP